jgi:hypothetical protein
MMGELLATVDPKEHDHGYLHVHAWRRGAFGPYGDPAESGQYISCQCGAKGFLPTEEEEDFILFGRGVGDSRVKLPRRAVCCYWERGNGVQGQNDG